MALTISKTFDETAGLSCAALARGGKYICRGKITFDSSYPTNGEALAVTDISSNGTAISHIVFTDSLDGTTSYHWDSANSKILARKLGVASTVTTENVAGVASTPTAITVVAAEAVAISSHTGTLAHTPISVIACDIVAAGPAAVGTGNATTIAPATSLDVQFSGTTVNTLAADSATQVNVTYAWVSTAGVASTPHTHTAGTNGTDAGTEWTNASDLSAAGKACYYEALVAA